MFMFIHYSMNSVWQRIKSLSIGSLEHVSAGNATDFLHYVLKMKFVPNDHRAFNFDEFFSASLLIRAGQSTETSSKWLLKKKIGIKHIICAYRYLQPLEKKRFFLFMCRSCGSWKSNIWYACPLHVNITFGTFFFYSNKRHHNRRKNFNALIK